jgi:hypothetical protein
MIPNLWLMHFLGVDSGSGRWYLFHSGFGANFGEYLIAFGLFGLIRRHNCEVHRCWRLGRHATAAGHMVCRKHHPDDRLTAQQVAEQNAAALKTGGP